MKMRILSVAMGLAATCALVSGCSQPTPECTVGTASASPYAAKYTLVSGDPASSCGSIPGDILGLQVYNPPNGDEPDTTRKFLAIQSGTMGNMLYSDYSLPGTCPPPNPDGSQDPGDPAVDTDETHQPYGLGEFSSVEPDGDDLCIAPKLSPAQQTLPEGVDCEADPADPPAQAALDVTSTWSNAKVYVTAAALGTQMEVDLTYTEGTCSATYHAVGLWPAVGCEEYRFFKGTVADPDPDAPAGSVLSCDFCGAPEGCAACDPAADAEDCGDTNTCCEAVNTCLPNDALCDDQPDGSPYDLPFGSGIGAELRVKCDPGLLLCVLDSSSIPAFK